MANREFLMLAKDYDPLAHDIGGWRLSIKYDGQRCLWDGGVSRGVLKSEVPWSNTAKDERYVEPPVATGLWTRYGNVVHAPDWWLDLLPTGRPLDGELWAGRGRFQYTRKVVSCKTPDHRWSDITYQVFDSPSPFKLFETGRINQPNFKNKLIVADDCLEFYNSRGGEHSDVALWRYFHGIHANKHIFNVVQTQVPHVGSQAFVYKRYEEELARGGEGIMLRPYWSVWQPFRVKSLLKLKPTDEDFGKVVGYTHGIGKFEGLLGALIIEFREHRFEINVRDEAHRALQRADGKAYHGPPDESVPVPPEVRSARFPIGREVMFVHSGFTDAGIPRCARIASGQ